jgi:hypothetical protein
MTNIVAKTVHCPTCGSPPGEACRARYPDRTVPSLSARRSLYADRFFASGVYADRKTLGAIALRFLEALPDKLKPVAMFKIWVSGAEWRASVSAASGGVGGIGPTPESALDAAVDHWIAMQRRNA